MPRLTGGQIFIVSVLMQFSCTVMSLVSIPMVTTVNFAMVTSPMNVNMCARVMRGVVVIESLWGVSTPKRMTTMLWFNNNRLYEMRIVVAKMVSMVMAGVVQITIALVVAASR